MKMFWRSGAVAFSSLALFLCLYGSAHAQTNDIVQPSMHDAKTTQSPAVMPSSYIFRARPGDSLSLLVRRGLQLHTSLVPASAMYCESILVNQLGNGELEIDQNVEVNFKAMDNCVGSSTFLTVDQIAVWKTYADSASFSLEDIQPVNTTPISSNTPLSSQSAPPADMTTLNEPVATTNKSIPQTSTEQMGSLKTPIKHSISSWWYTLLAATVIVGFLLADQFNKQPK
jgi:hypothetical protein